MMFDLYTYQQRKKKIYPPFVGGVAKKERNDYYYYKSFSLTIGEPGYQQLFSSLNSSVTFYFGATRGSKIFV